MAVEEYVSIRVKEVNAKIEKSGKTLTRNSKSQMQENVLAAHASKTELGENMHFFIEGQPKSLFFCHADF